MLSISIQVYTTEPIHFMTNFNKVINYQAISNTYRHKTAPLLLFPSLLCCGISTHSPAISWWRSGDVALWWSTLGTGHESVVCQSEYLVTRPWSSGPSDSSAAEPSLPAKTRHWKGYQLSQLRRLWHFSSSVNSFFKCASSHLSGARCLNFWSDSSSTSILCANSEGSDETARMRRLAWAFAGRLCDKYHNLMSWLSWSFYILKSAMENFWMTYQSGYIIRFSEI